jgi:hypothetical protein
VPCLVQVAGHVVGSKKSPGDVYIRKHHLKELKDYMKNGVQGTRTKKHKHGKGRGKHISIKETFKVPPSGYIFTSRAKAKAEHLHYHAIYNHVVASAGLQIFVLVF